jgi:hypothetical protein
MYKFLRSIVPTTQFDLFKIRFGDVSFRLMSFSILPPEEKKEEIKNVQGKVITMDHFKKRSMGFKP